MLLYIFQYPGCKRDIPWISIESHSNVNLCPLLYLKAYPCCSEPFRKKLDGCCVYSVFLGKNRQQKLVCAKAIASWVCKVLGIAREHKSPGTLCWGAVFAALAAGVTKCPSCRQVTGPEFLHHIDIIFWINQYYESAPGFHSTD